MIKTFDRLAAGASYYSGHPLVFTLIVGFIVLWVVTGPFFHWSDTWQLIANTATTLQTAVMVVLIQAAQNRDAAALQLKLDSIIKSLDNVPNTLIGVERLTAEEIAALRKSIKKEVTSEISDTPGEYKQGP